MKRSKFTEAQIIYALRQAEAGTKVAEVCRKMGISIESFNGSLRDECLNVHWFLTLEDARAKIETWRRDYNAY